MREQRIGQRLALGQVQRCRQLLAFRAGELETLIGHVQSPWSEMDHRVNRRNSVARPTDRRGYDSRAPPNSPAHPRRGIRCSAATSRSSRNTDAAPPAAPGRRVPAPAARPDQVCARQGVLGGKILQRQIGGVAVMGMQHHEARFVARPAGIQEIAGRQSFPLVVVARPGGHAMDVGGEFRLRLRGELRPIPEDRMLDRAVDVEPPALAGNVRRQAEVEGRPVPGQMLSRRQPLLFGANGLSGEEAALARPALLAARQFADRGWINIVGHGSAGLDGDI